MFFNASIKVLNVVAECPKDKDILRTFYPKYCQILRTSWGRKMFAGPYKKKVYEEGKEEGGNEVM